MTETILQEAQRLVHADRGADYGHPLDDFTKTVDKKQSEKFGREIYLEPAKIRELKMVVVTVASF